MRDSTVEEFVAIATTAAAATVSSGDQKNYGGRGLIICASVSAYISGTLTDVIVQAIDLNNPAGKTYVTLYDFSALAIGAAGSYYFAIYPGAATAGAWKSAPIQGVVPLNWRLQLLGSTPVFNVTATVDFVG